jgi:hypothetical protein
MRHSITPVMNWKQRRRHGISMSRRQFVVLQQLEQSKLNGFEFMDLQGVHKNTLNFLQREDYIFASPGIDGTRYKITYRGLKVLRIFEQPTRNFDDMCPTCCERPKHFYNTGRKAGYCKECLGEMSKRAYKRKGYGIRQDRMCSRCRKFPVHVRKNGRAITYCMHCKNVLGRRQKKRMHKRNIRRIAAGELLPCLRPGCNEQRYHTANTVYDWCHKHYREYMNDYHQRKAATRPKKPLGRPKKVVPTS